MLDSPEAEAVRAHLRAQRLKALARANERRLGAAALKRDILTHKLDPLLMLEGRLDEEELEYVVKRGEEPKKVTVGDALTHSKVGDVLLTIPGIGRASMLAILSELKMTEMTRFRDLTPERRQDLTHVVRLLKWKS